MMFLQEVFYVIPNKAKSLPGVQKVRIKENKIKLFYTTLTLRKKLIFYCILNIEYPLSPKNNINK